MWFRNKVRFNILYFNKQNHNFVNIYIGMKRMNSNKKLKVLKKKNKIYVNIFIK